MRKGDIMIKYNFENYIKWLEMFTMKYSSFSDQDWVYGFNKLSDSDMKNVQNLHLLYKQIENYSIKNHISNIDSGIGNFYKLKSDNGEFEVGTLYGKGNLFFCNRVKFDDNKNIVNFNDIINYKNDSNIELSRLSNGILKLYKKGIPIEIIEFEIKNTIDRCKTLKKKI